VQSPGKYTLPLDAKTYVAGRSFPRPDDTRDRVLRKNTFAKCREGRGVLVGGLDTRPEPVLLGEPKYVCGVQHLGNRRPCVVYSFGSSNEIMFEIGIKALAPQCDVHTFDHITLPEAASVRQFNFSVHRWALGTGRSTDPAPARTLDAIMRAFNHSHVDILKIDIEVSAEVPACDSLSLTTDSNVEFGVQNAEVAFLDWLFRRPSLMKKIDQIAIEFHSVRWMRDYIGGLVQRGFRPTHARVNDAHDCCAEVAFQSSTVTIE
jgi:hypothetical protein